ncbi:hypothetical protein SYV04_07275 [Hyalangium sp. s54d21]|uniref:DUF1279 domain-containing protein n=1 Tax=Hyalangium rubrum TaxID=3103134 RepID=A0ABU5GZ69_9BACT|nr:hypothetical protein [Hyalangium sp. s54d21]
MKPTSTDTAPAPVAAAKPSLKERFKSLLVEYGQVAIIIYFVIFGLCIAGFAVAIPLGFKVEGASDTTNFFAILGASWVATKVLQPLRILATLALTPVIGRFVMKRPKPQD